MNTHRISRQYKSFPAELIVTRHGQSMRNVTLEKTRTKLFYDTQEELEKFGSIPDHRVPLTEIGVQQAKEAGARLANQVGSQFLPQICIHSGYERARLTALHILEELRNKTGILVPQLENYSLRERESGITHVMLASEVEELLTWNNRYWQIVGSLFGCPLGGESLATLREGRIRNILREDLKQFAGKRVMLVCHGRVMQAIHMELMDMTINDMELYLKKSAPENCEMRRYVATD